MKQNRKYLLSLPERSIRFVTSIATSITSLLTKTVLPKPIQNSTLYQMTFGLLQDYLIEQVAQVQIEEKTNENKDYIYKKTAGSIIEGIGLLTFHYSPIWLLAMISDIAGGSQIYLKHLTQSLKEEHMIDSDVHFNSTENLLSHIQNISQNSARFIDQPPIKKDEFMSLYAQLKQIYEKNPNVLQNLFNQLDIIYKNIGDFSKDSHISLDELNGAITMDLIQSLGEKTFQFSKLSSKVTLDILNTYFIQSYQDTLMEIERVGPQKYLQTHMQPFIQQLTKHFKKDKLTTTEKIINYFEKFSK